MPCGAKLGMQGRGRTKRKDRHTENEGLKLKKISYINIVDGILREECECGFLPGPVCELRSPGGMLFMVVRSVLWNTMYLRVAMIKKVKKFEVALLGTQDSGQLSTVNMLESQAVRKAQCPSAAARGMRP